MRPARRRERGVALLLVVSAVLLLTVLAVELAGRSGVDAQLAARLARESAFRRLHDSGIEIGRALLEEPRAERHDHWGERWAEGLSFTLAPGESGKVEVADESGKLHLLRGGDPELLGKRLDRLFTFLRKRSPLRAGHWRRLEEAVLARTGLRLASGAAPPPPLVTLDGLREAGLGMEDVFGEEGLHLFLTTFGDGKLNVNTAPAAVLYAFDPEISEELADRIAGHRGSARHPGKPFRELKDLALVEGVIERTVQGGAPKVARDLLARLSGRLKVQSSAFSVRVQAELGERRRDAWAFYQPGLTEKAGEVPRRRLERLAFEEVRPW